MSTSTDTPSTSYDGSSENTEQSVVRPRSRKKAGRLMTQEMFDALSKEEQSNIALLATHELLRQHTTKIGEEDVTLWDLAVALELSKLGLKTGLGRSTVGSPAEEILERPGWMMRQGATKMQLKPEEEAALELELLGRGHMCPPSFAQSIPFVRDMARFIPQRHFSYGVFCKPHVLREALSKRYAERDPLVLLKENLFYQDVILHAPALELTTMLVVNKDLPIEALARHFGDTLQARVDNLTFEGVNDAGERLEVQYPVSASERQQVQRMAALFTPAALGLYPITTPDNKKVLRDTTFFFSATPTGGVAVEVQRPGTLREQEQYLLGEFDAAPLTYAVFDLFMGRCAIDPIAKIDIGACVLYFANGFTMEDNPNNPHQWRPGDELKGGIVEALDPSLDLFNLKHAEKAEGNAGRMLVKGIRMLRARRKAAAAARAGDSNGTSVAKVAQPA